MHVVLLPFPGCIIVNETKTQHFLIFSFGFCHIYRCVSDISVLIILAAQVSRSKTKVILAWAKGNSDLFRKWPSSQCYVN